jgi:hypothetical protein
MPELVNTPLTSFNTALGQMGVLSRPELDRMLAEVDEEVDNKIVKSLLKQRLRQADPEGTPSELSAFSQFSLHGNAPDVGGNL